MALHVQDLDLHVLLGVFGCARLRVNLLEPCKDISPQSTRSQLSMGHSVRRAALSRPGRSGHRPRPREAHARMGSADPNSSAHSTCPV